MGVQRRQLLLADEINNSNNSSADSSLKLSKNYSSISIRDQQNIKYKYNKET